MIGRLTGILGDESPDGSVIVDVQGVGYEVFVPLGTLGRVGRDGPVSLFVHTHVREDALVLYGFATAEDRASFRSLMTVTGVGPKLALAILSQLDAGALFEAVERGDKNAFRGISGVGKKTVEHLLVDLKGKLSPSASRLPPRPVAARSTSFGGQGEILVGLLVNLGYKRPEAERAIDLLDPASLTEKPVQELLREALRHLSA
ncbi:MAG: Holliday junction branch migration protein RuvA [Polyangiales bacterium]